MPPKPRVIFITGTDTGVGKTVLTALLLQHLRAQGVPALALKPFCSGGRADAKLLWQLQDGELGLDEINPWFFPEPLAPWVAARKSGQIIEPTRVCEHIRQAASRLAASVAKSNVESRGPTFLPCLLVEGSGGLLVPLARKFTVLDFIRQLGAEVLVVARNRLGTLNHTLMTVRLLQSRSVNQAQTPGRSQRNRIRVVLMGTRKPDTSSATNAEALRHWLHPVRLSQLPWFGGQCRTPKAIKRAAKLTEKTLGELLK